MYIYSQTPSQGSVWSCVPTYFCSLLLLLSQAQTASSAVTSVLFQHIQLVLAPRPLHTYSVLHYIFMWLSLSYPVSLQKYYTPQKGLPWQPFLKKKKPLYCFVLFPRLLPLKLNFFFNSPLLKEYKVPREQRFLLFHHHYIECHSTL